VLVAEKRPEMHLSDPFRSLVEPLSVLITLFQKVSLRLSEKGLKYTRWWVPDVAIGRTKAFFLAPFAASQVPVWSLSRIFRQSLYTLGCIAPYVAQGRHRLLVVSLLC